jgi:hypothetical protein
MDVLRDQIRAAEAVYVGTYDPVSSPVFVQVPDGSPQRGNALEIALTNNSSVNYTIFYQSTARTNISYFNNNSATSSNVITRVLANYVTNYYCFSAEDYQGTIQTNYQNNPVIHVVMQFYQWEYPIGIIGGSGANAYNSYILNARVSQRAK